MCIKFEAVARGATQGRVTVVEVPEEQSGCLVQRFRTEGTQFRPFGQWLRGRSFD